MRIGDTTKYTPSPRARGSHERSTYLGPIDFSRYLQRQNEETSRAPETGTRRVERPDAPTDATKSRYAPASPQTDTRPSYAMPRIGDVSQSKHEHAVPRNQTQRPVQHIAEQYHPIGTRVDVLV